MQRQYLPHSNICQGEYVLKEHSRWLERPQIFNRACAFAPLDRTRLRVLNLMRSNEVCVSLPGWRLVVQVTKM